MGMDAKARLWYGTRDPNEAVLEALRDGEVSTLGVCIEMIFCGDALVGVGGTAVFSWWDENPDRLDLDARLAPVRVAVAAFLAQHGDESECGVYLTADFS